MTSAEYDDLLVSVIIPFFQRQPGILRKALDSIIAQQIPPGVRVGVIIVDDSSPIAAAGELPLVSEGRAIGLDVISQANGGVSAARNLGLDAVPPEAAFVAFLDSDDTWAPDHLATALKGLMRGAELFFSNNQVDQTQLWFNSTPRFKARLDAEGRTTPNSDLKLIGARSVFEAFLVECPAHTSTVVFKRSTFERFRFDPDLKVVGEDHLFWLKVVEQASTVAVSTRVTAYRGHGVDIYRSAESWDSPDCLPRLCGNLLKENKILASFNLTPEQVLDAKARRGLVQQELLVVALRGLVRFPKTVKAAFAAILIQDSSFFPSLCANLMAIAQRYRQTGRLI